MLTFMSRWADLRCPQCDQLQSYVAARLTFRLFAWHLANDFVVCEGCATRLRMALAVSRTAAILTGIGVALLGACVFFAGALTVLQLLGRAGLGWVWGGWMAWIAVFAVLSLPVWIWRTRRVYHMIAHHRETA